MEIKELQINLNEINKELILNKSESLLLQNENNKLKTEANL